MSSFYAYQASKEEAAAFFPEYSAKFPDDPNILGTWIDRIVRDEGPVDQGLELAEKLRKKPELSPYTILEQLTASLYMMKGDKAKADEVFGKDFAEGQVDILVNTLLTYAEFWVEKDANKDSALAMTDKAIGLAPDDTYYIQQAAGIYVKAGQEAKALAIFGPDYLKKNFEDAAKDYGYAIFWIRQDKNIQSALVAAEKACALKPGIYYYWKTVSDAYAKMKKYPEAIKAGEKAVETAKGQAKDAMQKALDKIKKDAEKK